MSPFDTHREALAELALDLRKIQGILFGEQLRTITVKFLQDVRNILRHRR